MGWPKDVWDAMMEDAKEATDFLERRASWPAGFEFENGGFVMIDIHCHPLPSVDDGAKTLEEAVEMCRMAASDGTTHLVATPHCNYDYPFHPEVNQEKLRELQAAVGEMPKLLLGCDFHLSYDNINQIIKDRGSFTINHSRYVLVEFDDHFIPENMDHVFYDLQVAGLVPILTHPERNPVLHRKPEMVYQWVTRGCLVQITAQSLTGNFGSTAQRLSEMWLARNLVHFFASDAHNTTRRPPLLSLCYDRIAADKGKDEAERLLLCNPGAVIEDKPLPPGPEPLAPQPPKGWFSWLRRGAIGK
jgi:protein-tyrosine phosphatase